MRRSSSAWLSMDAIAALSTCSPLLRTTFRACTSWLPRPSSHVARQPPSFALEHPLALGQSQAFEQAVEFVLAVVDLLRQVGVEAADLVHGRCGAPHQHPAHRIQQHQRPRFHPADVGVARRAQVDHREVAHTVAMVAAPTSTIRRWLASRPQRARWNSFNSATAEVAVMMPIQIRYMSYWL